MKLEEAIQQYDRDSGEHTPEEYAAFSEGWHEAATKLARTAIVVTSVMYVAMKEPRNADAQMRSGQALAMLVAEASETLEDLGEGWGGSEQVPTIEWKLAVRRAIAILEEDPRLGAPMALHELRSAL